MTTSVEVVVAGLTARTVGLCDQGLSEVSVVVEDERLVDEAVALLRHVLAYLTTPNIAVHSEETMTYGYWLLKFRLDRQGNFELWEYNPVATDFQRGATVALRHWRDRHEVCERYRAEFTPPRPDRLVVVSVGVDEGDPVQGVRYPSPAHMSGWWITTDRHDGDSNSLRPEHLYHLTAARPNLARYLALPPGYRFDTTQGEDVWFESEVASETP